MNFLAHFHLAWPNEAWIGGALEGDYYKGPLKGTLPSGIEKGIALHRSIDAYTDSHPIIGDLRTHFPTKLRRYCGILIDISFDHYLTKHWADFHSRGLEEFNQSIYTTLLRQESILSPGSRRMITRLVDYDILNAYHDWNAVSATASRVGERFRRGNPLREVHTAIDPLKPQLESAFLKFYPELQNFCRQYSSGT